MSQPQDGGPAFPQGEWQNPFQYGMSLRDFFAAAVLTGLLEPVGQDLFPENRMTHAPPP